MQKYYYLIFLQYLGFRYHGWMAQPGQLTIQKMVNKTVNFVLTHNNFKTLAAGRTDARVSANQMAFELFVNQPLDIDQFLHDFNLNLPNDIRALRIIPVDSSFNIIQAAKTKEYLYLFSFGEKAHPFAASLISTFTEELDLELMQRGARLFEGTHDFRSYTIKPAANAVTVREITHCSIENNTFYTASFFPEKSYALKVVGRGFGRYQIRMMMGQLLELGRGNVSLADIRQSLMGKSIASLKTIAPGSGLILNTIEFDDKD